jgi:pimeloyl-ACP methyl ester carboxylesterase
MDYDVLAEDVILLIEELGIPKATLIGHSMGGRTMMAVSMLEVSQVYK